MIVVVFLIALVMILGGGAATFFGSDILLGDRGLPMVIAGSIVASAGALMLGLGFVVRGLSRIERQVGQVRDGIADVRAANLLATARPPLRIAPVVPVPVEEVETTEEGAALVVPDAPRAEPPPAPQPAAPRLSVEQPSAPPRPAAPPASEPFVIPPSRPEPVSVREDAQQDAEPSVVGRYESGGNAYTMFSDGSITADTASGQLRFNSLDELKAFVSSGGESR